MFKRPYIFYQFKLVLLITIVLYSCTDEKTENKDEYIWKSIEVTVTAYNSFRYQTSSTPNITAWGDSLKPGMPYIAVSRDLIEKGLVHNTLVKLEGFKGTFLVKDKMNKRWRNRIDIYMGKDIKKAEKWGKQKLKLQYAVLNTISTNN